MEHKKLYVLAKVRKLPTFKEYGEYEVAFLYSDKEKNFKRIADCTPEVQKLVASNSVSLTDIHGEFDLEVAVYCFNCNTKENIRVCEETLPVEEYLKVKESLLWDCIYTDIDDDYSAWHLISNLVSKITAYGSKDNGKVFLKCGNKAKVEVTFSVEFEAIDEILDEYFG